MIIKSFIKINFLYTLGHFSLSFTSLLLGFFIANTLATIPSQTGDWNITAASVLTTISEITSKLVYQNLKHNLSKDIKFYYKITNNLKTGILYGFFVDAFKLGS